MAGATHTVECLVSKDNVTEAKLVHLLKRKGFKVTSFKKVSLVEQDQDEIGG